MSVRVFVWVPLLSVTALANGCAGIGESTRSESRLPTVAASAAVDPGGSEGDQKASGNTRLVGFADSNAAPLLDANAAQLATPDAATGPNPNGLAPRTVREVLVGMQEPTDLQPQAAKIDIDLTSALAMAAGQSPRVAYAAARVREAYAHQLAADTLWLPNIRMGMSYNHHDGTLQASPGTILDASRSSLQAGMGMRAVGAGSPASPGIEAVFHTADTLFAPKIAANEVAAANAGRRGVTNETLLDVALAYLDVLRSVQQLQIAVETRDHADTLVQLTGAYARTGQGSEADADRAQTERVMRQNGVVRAQEAVQVASARLAEVLSIDPTTEFALAEVAVVPIDLVPLDQTVADLLATGLSNRPELAQAQALVCEAVYRYRREKYAPMLPSVLLGLSQSRFGGGFGSTIADYRNRFDVDASVYWEVRGLGFGERAHRDEMRAQYAQSRARQARLLDKVAREVVEARTQVVMRHRQIGVTEKGIAHAVASYEKSLARIREGQGLPLEALQSLQALDQARREYLRVLTDYNEAQFRLQCSLGWPIQ